MYKTARSAASAGHSNGGDDDDDDGDVATAMTILLFVTLLREGLIESMASSCNKGSVNNGDKVETDVMQRCV